MLSCKPAPAARCSGACATRRACTVLQPVKAVARDEQVELPRRSLMAAMVAVSAILSGPARADEAGDKRAADRARRKAQMAALRAQAEADIAAGPAESRKVEYVETSRGYMELDLSGLEERQKAAAESAEKLKALKDAEYSKMADRARKTVPPV